MNDFYHQRLTYWCKTIIETGIDLTANTILMDRADNLGLAQLHQPVRSCVGRVLPTKLMRTY
ncbi:hypothetical protein OH492_19800 [Vibrio chagasii]|nr:hypothetical protein [Vibrio chagasii]